MSSGCFGCMSLYFFFRFRKVVVAWVADKSVLMEQVNGPVLIEDSAVIFHALNQFAGPYMYVFPPCLSSAFNDFTSLIPWINKENRSITILGLSGLNRVLAGHEDKSAAAVCNFAFSWGPRPAQEGSDSDSDSSNDTSSSSSEPEVFLFQGRNEGQIVPERGDFGFG